ncbi:hypothetical protein HAX54_052527 [Datura stramonium]|uniref:Uncharacterized protein n=1 Tax=Datura stramonium TaxID=4076 RepID=A0ABS8WRF0_DATST|nr:hypothetical protein [Datura stramonium]
MVDFMLIQEESQRIHGASSSHSGILGHSLLDNDSSGPISVNASNMRSGGKKNFNANLYCDNCKLTSYTREICYKLVRYPAHYKFNNNKKKGPYNGPNAMAHSVNMTMGCEMQNTSHMPIRGFVGTSPLVNHQNRYIHPMSTPGFVENPMIANHQNGYGFVASPIVGHHNGYGFAPAPTFSNHQMDR